MWHEDLSFVFWIRAENDNIISDAFRSSVQEFTTNPIEIERLA